MAVHLVTSKGSLFSAFIAAVLLSGCATTGGPTTADAMGQSQARAIECDMTATRIKPRDCNANASAKSSMSKEDMLEIERRAQQVQVPLPPQGR
jgi:glycerol dehydrogenase-like iron-containing ADH family enzyme